MDYLSQYADFLKKRSPASQPIPDDSAIAKLMLAQNNKPKLETDMSLPGAEIIVTAPKAAPMPEVQDMPVSEIVAEAKPGPESKYNVLNRILGVMQSNEDKFKIPEEQRQSILQTMGKATDMAAQPRKAIDLSDLQARMAEQSKPGSGEWNTSDYVKAALVATLPALAGGLAGGLAGAAGGAPGGVKGIDYALKSGEDRHKSKSDNVSKEAELRIKQFNAESQADARQIKTLADMAKLSVDVNGKLTEPVRNFIKTAFPQYSDAEVDLYERELQEQGLAERQVVGEETKSQIAGDQLAAKVGEGEAGRKFKAGENQADRDFKAEQAALDRQLKERIARQAAKAKVSAGAKAKAEKPPTESQTKNAYYYNRAVDADKIAEKMWLTPDFDSTKWPELVRNAIPGKLRPFLSNLDAQRYDQAKEDFVTAILRPESGAVISDDERKREEAKYFPVAGDFEETVEQKRRARQAALAGLKSAAGQKAEQSAKEEKGISRKLDPKVVQVATESGISYGQARQALINRGYVPIEEETTEQKK